MAGKKKKAALEIATPNVEAASLSAAKGHNSGVNPRMQQIIEEILENDKQKALLNKANRELRNEAKLAFGVLSGPLAHEIKLLKMDTDARIQYESSHADLKDMLGYQISLDLAPATIPRTEEEYADPSDPTAEANALLNRR